MRAVKTRFLTVVVVGVPLAAGLVMAATITASPKEKAAAPAAVPGEVARNNDYTRSVAKPYEQVLNAVQAAAKAQGFRVSNVHDIAASLRKEGIDREPVAAVEVCNSKLAAQVLEAEPRLASLMPCRIAVFAKDKETVVSMVLPSRLMTFFPEKPEVKEAAAQVDKAMKAIVDRATQ